MISLKQFCLLDSEAQECEIDFCAKKLELTYRAYESSGLLCLRGQMWKLEKYLILYHYLSKN